ncbi:hypothetical protein EUA68_01750 [TM7 phylum sp. oral taxon 352]|nr:hypothetical protein EUA75_01140 [TM7 phylum sp. oral taxon 353]TWP17618.1 hypothetical protein EUA68_01750 [TM7 phylum sp. oral taxon 352]
MQTSKKDIYLVAEVIRTDDWLQVYRGLEQLGHSIHTISQGYVNDDTLLLDDIFLPATIDKIKTADFIVKVGSKNDPVVNYQLGAAKALKKRIVNILPSYDEEMEKLEHGIYEITQSYNNSVTRERLINLLGKIEETSLDIRFNLFIDKRIDLFLKEAVSCSSKSKSEIIRDLIYKEINYGLQRSNDEFWQIPPRIKVLEALGAIADGRIIMSIGKNQAMVHASNGRKTYVVSYDESQNSIVSNDNGSYFAGFIGYPAIAMLMKIGKIQYNNKFSTLFKGFKWKPINDKFPGAPKDAEEYLYTHLLSLPDEKKKDIQRYCERTLEDISHIRLRKPNIIPRPPKDI